MVATLACFLAGYTLTFKLKIASERSTDMVRRSSRLLKVARAG
jgi:hypothetical protein